MGEARRKKLAREAAFAEGRKFQIPDLCPQCQAPGPARFTGECAGLPAEHATTVYGVCWQCKALWEAFPVDGIVEDPVCAEPCDNCAFRPGSPEQADPEEWRKLLDKLKPDPETEWFMDKFYCHKNVPIDREAGPGNFLFPKKPGGEFDTARMRTCSGFLRMVWGHLAKIKSKKHRAGAA